MCLPVLSFLGVQGLQLRCRCSNGRWHGHESSKDLNAADGLAGPLLLYKSVEQSPRCPPVHLCMRAGWYVRAAIVLSLFQYVLALSFCLDCFQDSKPMPDMSGPTHRHEGSVDCSRTSGPRLSIPSIAKSFFQLQTASLQHQQPSRYLLPTPAVLAELPLSFLSGVHCSGLPQAQAELIACSAPVNHS